ncbi:sigma factor-like helix-turn-helix DNA-binding protein [Cyclobacterium jeungdonense]|uniref:sigma factor-like helix-turn-helix DNA-binding protein n=1 Tax=Cyclobacterium jeungdonense TaxID=708087 RepID=UPI0013D344FF
MTYKELEDAATELIRNLPKTQQKVFVLNKIDGLSSEEIASRLSLSKRTVEHQIYLATKFLKGELIHKASLYGPLLFIFFKYHGFFYFLLISIPSELFISFFQIFKINY